MAEIYEKNLWKQYTISRKSALNTKGQETLVQHFSNLATIKHFNN